MPNGNNIVVLWHSISFKRSLYVCFGNQVSRAHMFKMDQVEIESMISPIYHPLLKKFSRPTIYRWLLRGKLRGIRVGCTWLTTTAWVEEFVEQSSAVKPVYNRLAQVKAAEARMAARQVGKKLDHPFEA